MQLSLDANRFSLASLNLDCAGVKIIGCQDFTCKEELDSETVYGNGSVSLGSTVGKHSGTGSITLLPEEADSVVQRIGPAFGTVYWSLGATFLELQGGGIYVVTCTRVKLKSKELKPGEAGGAKATTIPMDLVIHDPINWNGYTIVDMLPMIQGGSSFGSFGLSISL